MYWITRKKTCLHLSKCDVKPQLLKRTVPNPLTLWIPTTLPDPTMKCHGHLCTAYPLRNQPCSRSPMALPQTPSSVIPLKRFQLVDHSLVFKNFLLFYFSILLTFSFTSPRTSLYRFTLISRFFPQVFSLYSFSFGHPIASVNTYKLMNS